MLIGYARVSKADGSQSLDLQRVALQAAGVRADRSGARQLRARVPGGRRARRLETRPVEEHRDGHASEVGGAAVSRADADLRCRRIGGRSFHDRSTAIGWVVGLGVESPLAEAWTVRLEGLYLDFGQSTHDVNRSGDGRCGPGMPRRPCPYTIEHQLGTVRMAIIHRFGR